MDGSTGVSVTKSLQMNPLDMAAVILLLLFWAVFVSRTVMQARRGFNPLKLGAGKRGMPRFLEFLFFIGFTLWTYEVFAQATPLPPVFPTAMEMPFFGGFPELLRVFGLVFMVLGIIVFLWALVSFGNSWRIGVDRENPGALVTSGAFARSRNPIFFAMDLVVFGTYLLYPTLVLLLVMVGMIAGIHIQILQEEEFLLSQYGEAYTDYKKKVRRYF